MGQADNCHDMTGWRRVGFALGGREMKIPLVLCRVHRLWASGKLLLAVARVFLSGEDEGKNVG